MLVLALNTGHDGAFAAVEDGKLLFSQEAEKDSVKRYSERERDRRLERGRASRRGTGRHRPTPGNGTTARPASSGPATWGRAIEKVEQRPMNFLGQPGHARLHHPRAGAHHVARSHWRPATTPPVRAALVWEGLLGKLYWWTTAASCFARSTCTTRPGTRWALSVRARGPDLPRPGRSRFDGDAGKLMALAAYGDPADADPGRHRHVDRVLPPTCHEVWPAAKHKFRGLPDSQRRRRGRRHQGRCRAAERAPVRHVLRRPR